MDNKNKEKRSLFSKMVGSSKSINKTASSSSLSALLQQSGLSPINELTCNNNYNNNINININNNNLIDNPNDLNCDTSSTSNATYTTSTSTVNALDPECLKSCYIQVKDLIDHVVIEKTNQQLTQELLAFRFLIEKFNVLIKVSTDTESNDQKTIDQCAEIRKNIKLISTDLKNKIENLNKV